MKLRLAPLALLFFSVSTFALEKRAVFIKPKPANNEKQLMIGFTFARDLEKSDCNSKFLIGEIKKVDSHYEVDSDGGYSSTRMGCLQPPKPATIYAGPATIYIPYNSRRVTKVYVPANLKVVYQVYLLEGGYRPLAPTATKSAGKVVNLIQLPPLTNEADLRVELNFSLFLPDSDCNGKYLTGKIVEHRDTQHFDVDATGEYLSTAVACTGPRHPETIYGESLVTYYRSHRPLEIHAIEILKPVYRILIPDGGYRLATEK